MTEFLYGESVRIGNTFATTAGVAYDPDTISLEIFNAEGTSMGTFTYAASEIVRSDIGVYYYDYIIPLASTSQGYWVGVWTATVTASGQVDVSEEQFYARPSAEKLYVSVSQVKDALMTSGVQMTDDTIRNSIRAAMAEVDHEFGRSFTNANTVTEMISTNQSNPNTVVNTLFLAKLPVQSITSLKEIDTSKATVKTYTSDEYWVDSNGILELTTGSFVHQRNRVEVIYEYGYTSVPIKVSKLTSVIVQLEVMRHAMIAADDQMTSFSIPDIGDVQLGEVYVTSVRAIEQLNKQKKELIKTLGNLRNDVIVI